MRIKFTPFIVFLLSLGWLPFSGCVTHKSLIIEVLVPPDTLIYPGLKSATLISRDALIGITDSLFKEDPDSLLTDTAFRKEVIKECLQGFRELLETSPGIERVVMDTLASGTRMLFSNHPDDTLDHAAISTICLNANTDIVVVLEGVYGSDTLWGTWVYQTLGDGRGIDVVQYHNLALILGARWSVYDALSCSRLEHYLYVDTVIWSSEVPQTSYDIQVLPEPEDAYLEAFYWAGNGYGRRIVSTWEETERFYYCTHHKLMKQACLEASGNRWREAAIIWKELSGHKNKSLAAKACFNMALACELEDKLDLAQSWAIKSYLLDKTRAVDNYINIINIRIFVTKRYDF
jgi:hypothetical protein